MSRSLVAGIIVGVIIFMMALARQITKLRDFVPSKEDFSKTTSIYGTYSFERLGRRTLTRIDDRLLYCGINYHGGYGSCYLFLKSLPKNSKITVTAASINTTSGDVLYAMGVSLDGQGIYKTTPDQSLRSWWHSSRLESLGFPLNCLEAYCLIIALILIVKNKDNK